MKGFALDLALKKRLNATRKWAIMWLPFLYPGHFPLPLCIIDSNSTLFLNKKRQKKLNDNSHT